MFEGPSREDSAAVFGRDLIDQAVKRRILRGVGREEVEAKMGLATEGEAAHTE